MTEPPRFGVPASILMFVKPPGPRHAATEEPGGLTIRIPSKRNVFMIGFLSLWLCGWMFAEVTVPLTFFTAVNKNPGAAAFTLVWLGLWTVGGAFAIYTWLWQVKGCEVVTVSPTALGIKREIFGYGRTKQYDVAEIRYLRVAPIPYNPFDFRSGLAFWGIGGGLVAFDYGFKTFRFGAGVDEAEARLILQTIAARLPRLAGVAVA